MRPTARPYGFVFAAALLTVLAGCAQVSAPRVTEEYVLDRLNGQALPAPLDASAHRTIEVVQGTLTLQDDGRAHSTIRTRVTDAGTAPADNVAEVAGSWQRSGDRVVVTFSTGFTHTLEALAAGQRLRTVSTQCTGGCGMTTDILRIYEFQRASVTGAGGGS